MLTRTTILLAILLPLWQPVPRTRPCRPSRPRRPGSFRRASRRRSLPASPTSSSRSPSRSTTAAGCGSSSACRIRTGRRTGTGSDRVTILEDTDGDGRHDKRTVFYDKGVNLSGIEVGFGGVWLTAVPNLIFIPDANGDDKPDGQPQVLLDGWDLKAKHNVVGNLAWGPDGWLYGCNGILSNSKIGRPGTPDDKRVEHELRRVALSSGAAEVRGLRPRHDQPLGPRLGRPRPDVHHQLRHQAHFSRRARRRTSSGCSARTSTRTATA